jgi:hypothetical protein
MPHAFRFISAISLPLVLTLAAVTPVAAVDLSQQCSNTDDGYSVSLPRGWYYNERVEGGDLEDVAACRFFGPEDFYVAPQAGIGGMAIAIGLGNDGPPGEMTPGTTVDGKPAFVTETTVGEDGLEPAGTRHYDYWIEIGPDAWLVAGTSDAPNFVGDYEENKAVLDAMMDSLRFGVASLPDTALATSPAAPLALASGLAMILLALVATGRQLSRRAV